jgi:hypothetical protein
MVVGVSLLTFMLVKCTAGPDTTLSEIHVPPPAARDSTPLHYETVWPTKKAPPPPSRLSGRIAALTFRSAEGSTAEGLDQVLARQSGSPAIQT